MADTATTPLASPTDTIIPAATSGHVNVGKKSPQPANKPKTAPTVQKSKSNPAPKPRQEYPARKPGKPDQQLLSHCIVVEGVVGPIPMCGDEPWLPSRKSKSPPV